MQLLTDEPASSARSPQSSPRQGNCTRPRDAEAVQHRVSHMIDAEQQIEPSRAERTCRLAQNLAIACHYAVFPCSANKKPTRPSEDNVLHGFHDATMDPDEIAWLWRNWPGELIGVATGAVSQLWVIDIDVKHREGCDWWRELP